MRKLWMFTVITLLTIGLVACGNSDTNDETEKDPKSSADEQEETIEVEHELGTTEVQKNPENVVVFDYGILDTLDHLEIDVAGVPQQGIPTYLEKYASDDYEHVGSLKEPDFEKLAEMNPDLIIISARQAEVYDELQEIAPTIYLGLDTTRYMDSFKENMKVVGDIFSKESEIKEKLETIDGTIATVKEKAEASGDEALIILANDDKISAFGPSSRFGLIHDVLGVPAVDENIEVSRHGMNVSFEYVVENEPDILYVVDRGAVVGGESSAKQVVENKLIKSTDVYKNDRIIYLNPEFWYLSGGGLISVQEMIQAIDESLE